MPKGPSKDAIEASSYRSACCHYLREFGASWPALGKLFARDHSSLMTTTDLYYEKRDRQDPVMMNAHNIVDHNFAHAKKIFDSGEVAQMVRFAPPLPEPVNMRALNHDTARPLDEDAIKKTRSAPASISEQMEMIRYVKLRIGRSTKDGDGYGRVLVREDLEWHVYVMKTDHKLWYSDISDEEARGVRSTALQRRQARRNNFATITHAA